MLISSLSVSMPMKLSVKICDYAANDARRLQEELAKNLPKDKYQTIVQIPLISDYDNAGKLTENNATKAKIKAVLDKLAGKTKSCAGCFKRCAKCRICSKKFARRFGFDGFFRSRLRRSKRHFLSRAIRHWHERNRRFGKRFAKSDFIGRTFPVASGY